MPDDSRLPANSGAIGVADAVEPLIGELQAAARLRGRGWITSHNVQFQDRDRDCQASVPLIAEFLAPGSGEDDDEPVYVYAGLSIAVIRPLQDAAVTVLTTARDEIDDMASPPLSFANLSPGDLGEEEMRAGFPGFALKTVARRAVSGGAGSAGRGAGPSGPRNMDRILSRLAVAANEQHAATAESDGNFGGDDPEMGFYSSLVVVDGRLEEVNVTSDSAAAPVGITHAHLRHRQAGTRYAAEPGARDHLIDFVTLSGLEDWAEKYEAWLDGVFESLIGNLISGE